MPCVLKSEGNEVLMKSIYLWLKLSDLNQNKHDIVLNDANDDDYALGLVQIGRFKPKICHFHQNLVSPSLFNAHDILWFELTDLYQAKCTIVFIDTIDIYNMLILVQIGSLQHEIYRAHQNVREIPIC